MIYLSSLYLLNVNDAEAIDCDVFACAIFTSKISKST